MSSVPPITYQAEDGVAIGGGAATKQGGCGGGEISGVALQRLRHGGRDVVPGFGAVVAGAAFAPLPHGKPAASAP
eukprot:scaffold4496_cov128-Isochrysis_galbana.AAC.9